MITGLKWHGESGNASSASHKTRTKPFPIDSRPRPASPQSSPAPWASSTPSLFCCCWSAADFVRPLLDEAAAAGMRCAVSRVFSRASCSRTAVDAVPVPGALCFARLHRRRPRPAACSTLFLFARFFSNPYFRRHPAASRSIHAANPSSPAEARKHSAASRRPADRRRLPAPGPGERRGPPSGHLPRQLPRLQPRRHRPRLQVPSLLWTVACSWAPTNAQAHSPARNSHCPKGCGTRVETRIATDACGGEHRGRIPSPCRRFVASRSGALTAVGAVASAAFGNSGGELVRHSCTVPAAVFWCHCLPRATGLTVCTP